MGQAWGGAPWGLCKGGVVKGRVPIVVGGYVVVNGGVGIRGVQ